MIFSQRFGVTIYHRNWNVLFGWLLIGKLIPVITCTRGVGLALTDVVSAKLKRKLLNTSLWVVPLWRRSFTAWESCLGSIYCGLPHLFLKIYPRGFRKVESFYIYLSFSSRIFESAGTTLFLKIRNLLFPDFVIWSCLILLLIRCLKQTETNSGT